MKKEGHPQLSGDIFSGTDGREQIADSDVETTAQKIAYGLWISASRRLPTPSHLRSGFLNPSKTSSGNSLHFCFTFFQRYLYEIT